MKEPFATLEELHAALEHPERPLDDEDVVDLYQRFLPSYSVLWSAGSLLGAAGFVCFHRPHLAERVLVRPIEYLYALGARTPEDVLRWLAPRLADELDARRAAEKSLLDALDEAVEGFDWLGTRGLFNTDRVVDALFRDLIEASGADAEGYEWLRANLPSRHDFLWEELERLSQRDQTGG